MNNLPEQPQNHEIPQLSHFLYQKSISKTTTSALDFGENISLKNVCMCVCGWSPIRHTRPPIPYLVNSYTAHHPHRIADDDDQIQLLAHDAVRGDCCHKRVIDGLFIVTATSYAECCVVTTCNTYCTGSIVQIPSRRLKLPQM